MLATKNHQGGLDDKDDESNGKIFQRPGSKRRPVKLISKYLAHFNPESSNHFQKPRSPCKSFNPAKDEVWYCSGPLGHNSLENMLRNMTSRAGIKPHFGATSVIILPAANYESRHIKAITGHQSEASIESYSDTPTFQQFKAMSNAIADFVDSGRSSEESLVLVAKTTEKLAVSSSTHSTSAPPRKSIAENVVEIQRARQSNQHMHLAHGLIPSGIFHGCTFIFTINLPGSSAQKHN